MKLIILEETPTKEHIGQPVIYVNADHQQIGVLCDVTEQGVEAIFRTYSQPMLTNHNQVKLIKLVNDEVTRKS